MKAGEYDFVILGAGCAGLSLLMRMLRSPQLSNKKILLVDKEKKSTNDRTWCYWEKEAGFFESIVHRSWKQAHFTTDESTSRLQFAPYTYKMIRGIDLYQYCFREIEQYPNVHIRYGNARCYYSENEGHIIDVNDERLCTGHDTIVFNSIYNPAVISKSKTHLLQHFKGWIIETQQPFFDNSIATIMDFRVQQHNATAFAYVLPMSAKKALVEYTVFSGSVLEQHMYDEELERYILNVLQIPVYQVRETEFGTIPMTNEEFIFFDSEKKCFNIGTAGGQTKPSTGYTFRNIQKRSEMIMEYLESGKSLNLLPGMSKKFNFYDSILLRILEKNEYPGEKIFGRLFQKNKTTKVLKFLDNESSLPEELKIIWTLPKLPFLKALFR